MTRIGTLWGSVHQRQTKIILSVAALNELELDQPEWTHANKPAEFTTKFAYGKIPAFEGVNGFKLIEGSTIARYLSSIGSKVNLLGSTPEEVGIVDQWVHFAEQEVAMPSAVFMGMVHGYFGTFDRKILDRTRDSLTRALDFLESQLASSSSGYVTLDRLTLADFALAGAIDAASQAALGSKERAHYPHIFAHYAKVTADERLKAFWGTESFVDVAPTEPKAIPTA